MWLRLSLLRHTRARATVDYIRHEPVRSVLAAAAAGAMVYALVRALKGRDRH